MRRNYRANLARVIARRALRGAPAAATTEGRRKREDILAKALVAAWTEIDALAAEEAKTAPVKPVKVKGPAWQAAQAAQVAETSASPPPPPPPASGGKPKRTIPSK